MEIKWKQKHEKMKPMLMKVDKKLRTKEKRKTNIERSKQTKRKEIQKWKLLIPQLQTICTT